MFYAPCDPNSSLYELGTILSGKEDIDKLNGIITISAYKEQDIPVWNIYLYCNRAEIARYVGTSDWKLPIYERDDDADYDVMQYYDVSSRYDIPSDPETVTSERAGEVYYSDPNRIVLFYRDAEITGEYTRIGTFDATDDFVAAVEEKQNDNISK